MPGPSFPGYVAQLHEFALMPDHVHGILSLVTLNRTNTLHRTLGSVVGAFKSRVTRLSREYNLLDERELRQRGFFDRVIRDERELLMARRYIRENAMATTLPPRITNR